MKAPLNQILFPFWTSLLLSATIAAAQTPAPATLTPFRLPLTDGTSANCQLLPALQVGVWMTYATKSGDLVVYLATPQNAPLPPPPPPPPPPYPQKLQIAIVVDPLKLDLDQIAVLADKSWRKLVAENHDFLGIIPKGIIEEGGNKPPARLIPFLDRAVGKNLPWVMFADQTGIIFFEKALPKTAAELIELIKKHGG